MLGYRKFQRVSSRTTPTATALFALVVCTAGWTFAPVFIRLLRNDYEPLTQGFVRYAFGSAFLLAVCFVYHRAALLTLLRNPLPILGISLLNTFQQYTWTAGTYGATATTAQLIVKLSVVFVVIFAFILFQEERAVIRNPVYLFGTLLSIVGVVGVMVRDPRQLSDVFAPGNVLLLITAMSWAVYAVWGKHLVLNLHPMPMFAVVSLITAIALGVAALWFEQPATALHVGVRTTCVAALSGVIAIGGAHPSFHYAQKHFGAAFTNSFMLIIPLTTYAAARVLLPGEKLSLTQWVGALTLLAGTLLIILVENRKRVSASAALRIAIEECPSPVAERAL